MNGQVNTTPPGAIFGGGGGAVGGNSAYAMYGASAFGPSGWGGAGPDINGNVTSTFQMGVVSTVPFNARFDGSPQSCNSIVRFPFDGFTGGGGGATSWQNAEIGSAAIVITNVFGNGGSGAGGCGVMAVYYGTGTFSKAGDGGVGGGGGGACGLSTPSGGGNGGIGGGGGGSCNSPPSAGFGASSGGGGGGFAMGICAVTPGVPINVTVGAPGLTPLTSGSTAQSNGGQGIVIVEY
jgi:hypothetical protein